MFKLFQQKTLGNAVLILLSLFVGLAIIFTSGKAQSSTIDQMLPTLWDEAVWNPNGNENPTDPSSRKEYYDLFQSKNLPSPVSLSPEAFTKGIGMVARLTEKPVGPTFTAELELPEGGTYSVYYEAPWIQNFVEYDGYWWTFFDIKIPGATTENFDELKMSLRYGECGEFVLSAYIDTEPQNLYNQVPLPAAFWLLGSGLIGLASLRRKLT